MIKFTINISISENPLHERFLNGGSQSNDGPRVAVISAKELVMKVSRRPFRVVFTRHTVSVSAYEYDLKLTELSVC